VDNASVFMGEEGDITAYLCPCEACMRVYAAHGVASWFHEPADLPLSASGAGSSASAAGPARGTPAALRTHSGLRGGSSGAAGEGAGAGGAAARPSSSDVVNFLLRNARATSQGADAARAAAASGAGSTSAPGASGAAESPQLSGGKRSAAEAGVREESDAAARLAELAPSLPADFKTSLERGLAALAALPTAAQVDALASYNAMKAAVVQGLRGIVASGRVVTPSDVQTWFAALAQERRSVRPRHEDGEDSAADERE
jgi:hypothetical protein